MIPYAAPIAAVAALAALGASFGAGWQARSILADNEALETQNSALKGYADATDKAAAAAADYAARRDAIQPEIRVVRVQAAPIIRELDTCALPVGAGGVLDRAANAADGKATPGGTADAARSETGNRQP